MLETSQLENNTFCVIKLTSLNNAHVIKHINNLYESMGMTINSYINVLSFSLGIPKILLAIKIPIDKDQTQVALTEITYIICAIRFFDSGSGL